MPLTESTVEAAALEWFRLRQGYGGQVGVPGYAVGHGSNLAPGEPAAEAACAPACAGKSHADRPACASHADRRESFGDVVLLGRLRDAIQRLNPTIPSEAREDALRKVLRLDFPSLVSATLRDTLLPKLLRGEIRPLDVMDRMDVGGED
jgi:type I restriction enzyme R subunit